MKLNLKKAMAFIQKDIKKNYPKLDFKYKHEDGEIQVYANGLTLKGIKGDLTVSIRVYEGGGAKFSVIFDHIDLTPETLRAINDFNQQQLFFGAYTSEKGYLIISNFFICYELDMLKEYTSEFLAHVVHLDEDENMVRLANFTYA